MREQEILARLRDLHPDAAGAVLSSDDLEGIEVTADIGDSGK